MYVFTFRFMTLLWDPKQLNEHGPFPEDTLLVSWDVVSMFPNIDNELGLAAVSRALDTTEHHYI